MSKKTLVTDEMVSLIIEDYVKNKIAYDKIATKYHIRGNEIRKILIKNNIKIRKSNDTRIIVISHEQLEKLLKNFKQYGVVLWAAQSIGISFYLAKKILKNYGFNLDEKRDKISYKKAWITKYTPEEFKKRDKEHKSKLSFAFSGEKNPMYGKPSPKKSGNGFKGWYNKFLYFRSLRELSYIISLENTAHFLEVCDESRFKIPYINLKGHKRNYFPDFIVNGQIIVEIKPKRLHSLPEVQSKKIATEEFCRRMGKLWRYKLIDQEILDEKIRERYDAGLIKFDKIFEKKFLDFHRKV